MNWKPWVIGGLVAIFIGLVVATRGGGSGPAGPAGGVAPLESPLGGDDLRVEPPPGIEVNQHAVKDWNKIVDQLNRQHYGEARRKLDEWERKWGPTPETRALHEKIDTLPDRGDRPGREE
jgi:hypothetical protein